MEVTENQKKARELLTRERLEPRTRQYEVMLRDGDESYGPINVSTSDSHRALVMALWKLKKTHKAELSEKAECTIKEVSEDSLPQPE